MCKKMEMYIYIEQQIIKGQNCTVQTLSVVTVKKQSVISRHRATITIS